MKVISLLSLVSLVVCGLSFAGSTVYITGPSGNLFNPDDRDDCKRPFIYLRDSLEQIGLTVKQVSSVNNLTDVCIIICWNVPGGGLAEQLKEYPQQKTILILSEPPSVLPHNYNVAKHHDFGTILTWNDDLVDGERYVKFFIPQTSLIMTAGSVFFEDKKLCTMIVSNKRSSHANQLYSERLATINFFEEFPCSDFTFFGTGWPSNKYKNYGGKVFCKLQCLQEYRFCFCYENMTNINGYISEKIFDAMVAGCVPIYWGAENIAEYIPPQCFIDRRDFASTREVYEFIRAVTQEQHMSYLQNIKAFLESEQGKLFSADTFVETIKVLALANK